MRQRYEHTCVTRWHVTHPARGRATSTQRNAASMTRTPSGPPRAGPLGAAMSSSGAWRLDEPRPLRNATIWPCSRTRPGAAGSTSRWSFAKRSNGRRVGFASGPGRDSPSCPGRARPLAGSPATSSLPPAGAHAPRRGGDREWTAATRGEGSRAGSARRGSVGGHIRILRVLSRQIRADPPRRD